jgi:thiol-disulfide isomerase/thioredoxin
MRKLLCLSVLSFLIFLLSGCQKGEKISLDSTVYVTSYEPILFADLESLLLDQADFALYISSESCSSCQAFIPILSSVISEYQIRVLQIEANQSFLTDNDLVSYNYTPTFVIFKAGEIISQIDPIVAELTFASQEAFLKHLSKYIILTKK